MDILRCPNVVAAAALLSPFRLWYFNRYVHDDYRSVRLLAFWGVCGRLAQNLLGRAFGALGDLVKPLCETNYVDGLHGDPDFVQLPARSLLLGEPPQPRAAP